MSNTLAHNLRRIQQRADKHALEALKKLDLTVRQSTTLAALRDLKEASQNDIVARTGIDRSTTSELLRRLEKRKLLSRRTNKKDRRAQTVRLNAAATRKLSAVSQALRRAEQLTLKPLTPKERTTFIRLSSRLAAHLSAESS